jgi:cbb3-type cytochrome oxidase subunit 3
MKLSDIVSNMNLSIYAEVPLLIFLGVFLGVVVHVLRGKESFEHARMLPLSEASPQREVPIDER